MKPDCYIELFGGLRIEQTERPIVRFRTYKTAALLAYLAFYQDKPHSREVLSGLFWPDAEGGRLSLRVALGSLRRQLEPPGTPTGSVLVAARACVQLNPEAVRTDVWEFDTALRSAAVAAPNERMERLLCAIEKYRGELLPGYYEDWIGPERERLAEAHRGALQELISLLEMAEDLNFALDCAHRAVIAARFGEDGYIALMRLYRKAGRPADALRQYERLKRIMKDELGECPAITTQQLAAEIACDDEQAVRRSGIVCPPSRAIPIGGSTVSLRSPMQPPWEGSRLPVRPRLPLNFNRFFGRGSETARLKQLLLPAECADQLSPKPKSGPRLITITGPGGIGKTRLAVETAHACSDAFNGDVWFVPLADINDFRLVPSSIADCLGIGRVSGVDPMEQVIQALSARPALLILDNLEHLLTCDSSASVALECDTRAIVDRLLRRAVALTCIVTSRQPLEVDFEVQFPVSLLPVSNTKAPLTTPNRTGIGGPQEFSAPQQLMQLPSVQMFVDRAQSVRPDFQLTPRNVGAVAALCVQLEGLPLSIELAAAWAQTLSPAQMLSHLASDALLVSRRKDRPRRHLSLCAAIEWSFQRLAPELQRLFARLSVFAGGWTLEAAADICEEPAPVTALAELRAHSVIVAEEAGDAMRYRLLETLRHFAARRITEQDRDSLALRHAEFYVRLAEHAETELCGARQNAWIERLAAEQDNLRAALEWAGSREIGLRLAGALRSFWEIRGEASEGRRWVTRALAGTHAAASSVRAKALYCDAALAAIQGDLGGARDSAEASWTLSQALGDPRGSAYAGTLLSKVCYSLGEQERAETLLAQAFHFCRHAGEREMAAALIERGRRHGFRGDYAPAETCLTESRALYANLGDLRGMAQVVHEQAIIKQYRQDFASAHAFYEEMLTLCRSIGDRVGLSAAMHGIGYIARLRGDYVTAAATFEECLSLQRRMVLRQAMMNTLRNLGCVAREQGEYARAMSLLDEALQIGREIGESQIVAETLGSMGLVALYRGNYDDALRLHEQCLRFRRTNGYKQDIGESLLCLAVIAVAESYLDRARTLLEEALALFREVGSPIGISNAMSMLSLVALHEGRNGEAEAYGRSGLALLKGVTAQLDVTEQLEQMARILQALGRGTQAVCILGATQTLRAAFGFQRQAFFQSLYEHQISAMSAELDPSDFADAWSLGSGMTLDKAVECALES